MDTGDSIHAENASWTFSGDTYQNFDAHILKSVPLYKETRSIVLGLSDFFVRDNSIVYDIGCSTGTFLKLLYQRYSSKEKTQYVGIDCVPEMIQFAQKQLSQPEKKHISYVVDDAVSFEYNNSCLITSFYTLQFIRPSVRQEVITKVYNALDWGAAFFMIEKVRSPDARFQDMMTQFYTDYKLEQGYDPEEIVAKSRSLKGILEPFSTQGNTDLLTRAGFKDITTVFKYACFEGFLAIK